MRGDGERDGGGSGDQASSVGWAELKTSTRNPNGDSETTEYESGVRREIWVGYVKSTGINHRWCLKSKG